MIRLLVCALVFLSAGGALADCFLTPGTDVTIAADLNTDLNDWGWILTDALDPGCDVEVTAGVFLRKLQRQVALGGWFGFLRGGAVSFAYATGIALNNRPVPAPLLAGINDQLQTIEYHFTLDGTQNDPEPDCGLTGTFGLYRDDLGGGPIPRWRFGNSCMDDYVVAAEGYAWRAAYKKRLGDEEGYEQDRGRMIDTIVDMFGPESICIYDRRRPLDPANGPCNTNDLDDLEASLDSRDEIVSVLALNHSQENPSYGIGLITSLTHSFAAMQAAGTPLDKDSFGSESRRIQLILRALFQEGQRTARNDVAFDDLCYFPPDDAAHRISKTHTAFTYFLDEDILAADARMRSCDDRLFPYSPWMFPVLAFYEKYGFAPEIDPNRFRFEGEAFEDNEGSVFTPAELRRRDAFFGLGRKLIYYTIAHDWTRNGLPAMLCMPQIFIGGPVAIVPRGRMKVSATNVPGLSYTWSIRNGAIASSSGNEVFIIASDSGAVTLTLDVTGGACARSSTVTKDIRVEGKARSFLLLDSVVASAGVPETIHVTLASEVGALEERDVVFSVLGKVIGTARTDSSGRASVVYLPSVTGNYENAVQVTYAGDALTEPATTSASLSVVCDGPAFAVAPRDVVFTEAASSVDVTVTAFGGCGWSAVVVGSAPWLTLENFGSGSFTIKVDALPASELSRGATILVAQRHITVRQTRKCSARLSPSAVYVPASTEVTAMDVAAPNGCSWTVVSNDTWLQLVEPNPERDDDPNTDDEWRDVAAINSEDGIPVRFRADNNSNPDRRRGHLTVSTPGGASSSASIVQYGNAVCIPPQIRVEPLDGSVRNGQNIALHVDATGTDLRYEWRASGIDSSVVAGPRFIIPSDHAWYPEKGAVRSYSVTVSNSCGTDTAVAEWRVSNDELTCRPPMIRDHPASQSSPEPGARVRLSVGAANQDGTGPLHYQWYAGRTGEKTAKIGDDRDFVDVFPHETSFYWIEVSDSCGVQNSGTAVVVTTLPPKQRAARP